MRVAVYYAPVLRDPLWTAGCAWLGRDPETGATLQQPDLAGIAEATGEPARYGFHATLKPPMRLAGSYDDFIDTADRVARDIAPFELPALAVAELSGFLALRETAPSPDLHALADACVSGLDGHRAFASKEEIERRRRSGLTREQDDMLLRWGYPHVFRTWRFHMTLTRRLSEAEHAVFRPAAERHFADALGVKRRVAEICVYTQAGDGAPFLIAERLALRG